MKIDMPKQISSAQVLYIKLGEKGEWEEDCINKGILRIGFRKSNFEDCQKGRWKAVQKKFFAETKRAQTATAYTTQVRYFFESSEDVLWITFFDNKLWWGHADKNITLLPDNTKVRKIIGGWRCCDLQGKELRDDSLSGALLKVRGFRSTVCKVGSTEYLLRKINAQESTDVSDVKEALDVLERKVTALIQSLHWKDFEILIDLMFRQEGWQRLSGVGKDKTLDLDLLLPLTNERAMVQIKSKSNKSECLSYLSTFRVSSGYDKYFYVVHTHDDSLNQLKNKFKEKNMYFLLSEDVSRLVVKVGLVNWVLGKCL